MFFRSLPFFMPERFRAELAPSAFRPWRSFQGGLSPDRLYSSGHEHDTSSAVHSPKATGPL